MSKNLEKLEQLEACEIDISRIHSKRFDQIFFAIHGLGPYNCHFCEDLVSFYDVHLHHKDHNRNNPAPDNIVPTHRGCHMRHHAIHRMKDSTYKKYVMDSMHAAGHIPHTKEWNEKISKSNIKAYDEGRKKHWKDTFNDLRSTCPICHLESNVPGIRRHLNRQERNNPCLNAIPVSEREDWLGTSSHRATWIRKKDNG